MSAHGRLILSETISGAWIEVLRYLLNCNGHCYNLMVQINDPLQRDGLFEEDLDNLCRQHGLLTIKQVAYTIFPNSLWHKVYYGDREKFFIKYRDRVFPRIKTSWGTYFHRMIHWTSTKKSAGKNQLGDMINLIIERIHIHKSAYTIQIGSPMMHFGRVLGAPCLNYIAFQLEPNRIINLMAVFRNHYLFPRIYGNYLGLGQLLEFICEETGFEVGMLTSISSHAGISLSSEPSRVEIRQFLRNHG